MVQYVYTFQDLRTRQKLGTLPLYGVNCSDLLVAGQGGASAGAFTGSIRMDNDWFTPSEILDITRPESTMVWMERDDSPIWCGILWTRTYQSDGRVIQLNAQTFSSYPSRVVWDPEDPLVLQRDLVDNPHNIIRYCYSYLGTEATEEYNVNLGFEGYHVEGDPVLNPEKYMSQTILRSGYKFLSEYISNALKAGAEYRIVPTIIDGERVPVFQSGFPGTLGVTQNAADQGAPYQYPGDLSKYWLTNSMSNAPTKLIGVGKASGQDDLVSIQQGSTAGRIGVDSVVSYETEDLTQLSLFASNDLTSMQSELNRPVYELNGGNVDLSWGLGDYRRVVIDDPLRFPTPMSGVVRLVGWTLSPASEGGIESMGITIDNYSNLVPTNV
jgi:hypothetical protein